MTNESIEDAQLRKAKFVGRKFLPLYCLESVEDGRRRREMFAETVDVRNQLYIRQNEEERRLAAAREPSREEIVRTKFNGDWELWSDQLSWSDDDVTTTAASAVLPYRVLKEECEFKVTEMTSSVAADSTTNLIMCGPDPLSPLIHQ